MGSLKFNYSVVVASGLPIISEAEYFPDTSTLDFARTKSGSLAWAIYWKDEGDPKLNSNGTWTGTVIESGQMAVPENDAQLTINYTTEVGNRLAYGMIDAAGAISNLVYEDVVINDLATVPAYVGEGLNTLTTSNVILSWPAGHRAGDMAIAVIGMRGNDAGTAAPAGWVKRGRYQTGATTAFAAFEVFTRTATSTAEPNVTFLDGWNTGLGSLQVYRPVQGGTLNMRNLGGRTDAANVAGATGTAVSIPGGATQAVRGRVLAILKDNYDNAFPSHAGLLNRTISAFRERDYFGGDTGVGGYLALYDGAFENGPDTIAAITTALATSIAWAGAIFEIYEV